MSFIVGVDTGGTFTDVVARDASGALRVHKLLSTPDDPSRAIAEGVEGLGERPEEWTLVHGTTVATNALLERAGARVGLVTTRGFEDVLELRRQARPSLYALHVAWPRGVVRRADTLGVDERLGPDGEVVRALTDDEIARAVAWVETQGLDAVAVCLLHSYARDDHERRLARALRDALPGCFVTASHELARAPREYERASTTALNSYVGPIMSRYLERLERRVDATLLEVFTSAGLRVPASRVAASPCWTVLSGPAGGVVGAMEVGRQLGIDSLLTFDMGGTSTDVALVDGAPRLSESSEIDGLSIMTPALDIHTVGAGGGSIAYRDEGGALRVGPRSAGAMPGPAAYGRGGREPTVTDAHVALGRLREDRFLGGEMALDAGAARAAIDGLAGALGVDPEHAAVGILSVADAAMARALKVISIEKGVDPRECALLSFGGAGGLHACRLARALEMTTVVVPAHPGLLSAYGMLHAERARTFSRALFVSLDDLAAASPRIDELVTRLVDEARAEMSDAEPTFELHASLRYVGQTFTIELPVDWSPGDVADDPRARFHARHARLYGWSDAERPVEMVGARVRAVDPSSAARSSSTHADAVARPEHLAPVVFGDGATHDARVIWRDALAEGERVEGPCVITEYSGTTVVPPGWSLVVRHAHMVLTFGGAE